MVITLSGIEREGVLMNKLSDGHSSRLRHRVFGEA